MSEIDDLVAEYNAAEAAQLERLIQLFRLVQARKNYRMVRFGSPQAGSHMWSNCWSEPERLAIPRHVLPMERQITEVVPGDE